MIDRKLLRRLVLIAAGSAMTLGAATADIFTPTIVTQDSPTYGCYVKADVGHTVGTLTKSMTYDLGFGWNWDEHWRSDLTFSMRPSGKYRIEHGPTHSPRGPLNNHTLMFNTFYSFNTDSQFRPYLGIGLGGFHNTGKNIEYTEGGVHRISHMDKSGFTASVNLGIEFAFNPDWSLDIGYKAIGLGYIKTDRYGLDGHSKTHDLEVCQEVMAGLSYHF